MALRHRTESISRIEDRLKEIIDQFALSDEKLHKLKDIVALDCQRELNLAPADRKRMLETYVINLPDGTEHGEYIVLDFGGKFFRVVYVKLNHVVHRSEGKRYSIAPQISDGKTFDVDPTELVYMESMIYPLGKKQLEAPYKELFVYIAHSCFDFCTRFKLLSHQLSIVLVNSFPCQHNSLQSAQLIRWTKGLNAPGAIGKDFGQELQIALENENLPHKVVSLINDTVACLFTGLSEDHNTRIGLIIGTGFNLAFLRSSDMDVFESESPPDQSVVINSELGNLGEDGELTNYVTEYDLAVSNGSHATHKGQQVFEKMLTGCYLPELFRVICKQLVDQGVLFNGVSSDILDTPGGIPQNLLAQVVRAGEEGLNHVQDVLINVEICAMYADADAVLKICKALILRSAALISATIAGVIKYSCPTKRTISISVDGSLYKSYPLLAKNINEMTGQLLGQGYDVTYRTSYDGSAKGAAFITAKNVP